MNAVPHARVLEHEHAREEPQEAVYPEERPIGLIGDLLGRVWKFNSNIGPRPAVITWNRRMANGQSLTHERNAKHWELCRRYVTAYRNSQIEDPSKAIGTLAQDVRVICILIDDAIGFGKSSLSELSYDEWEIVKKRSAFSRKKGKIGKRNTREHLVKVYSIISTLHRLYSDPGDAGKFILNDGPRFAVFSSKNEELALADLLGVAGGRTDDIPEEIAFPLLNAAIEHVALFGDGIVELRRRRFEFLSTAPEPRDRFYELDQLRAKVLSNLLDKYDHDPASTLKINRYALERELGLPPKFLSNPCYRELFDCFATFTATASLQNRIAVENQIGAYLSRPRRQRDRKRLSRDPAFIGRMFKDVGELCLPRLVDSYSGILELEDELWAAAYIVVAMFMADRQSEGLSLMPGCIVRRLDGPYIRFLTFKSENSEAGTLIERPCPEIVVTAIEVLTRFWKMRDISMGPWPLFSLPDSDEPKVPAHGTVNALINRFAQRVGANRAAGKIWPFKSHQFRRLFVTIWVSYYEFAGNIEALRKYLGHDDVRTTMRYATGARQGAAASEKQRELALRIMKSIAFDGREVQGGAAKRFLKLLTKFRIRLVPEGRIAEWLTHNCKQLGTFFTAMPWGYCVWSRIAGKHANCLAGHQRQVDCERPDHKEKCADCAGCGNFLTTDAFGLFWSSSHELHDRIAQNPAANETLRAAARIGRKQAQFYARMEREQEDA
jgi:integrase